eukprot:jgi/Phyca11/17639/fgenesh1_pg.PHYCAscaffold_29_\
MGQRSDNIQLSYLVRDKGRLVEEVEKQMMYRAAQKEHLQSVRDEETDRLQTLANAILGKRLALIYYYCCGAHPEAFVFNDEHLREDESVKERLLYALDSPNETHSFFRKEGIEIDTSEIRAEELTKLEENIENDVVMTRLLPKATAPFSSAKSCSGSNNPREDAKEAG